jgi:hypothetical protein
VFVSDNAVGVALGDNALVGNDTVGETIGEDGGTIFVAAMVGDVEGRQALSKIANTGHIMNNREIDFMARTSYQQQTDG